MLDARAEHLIFPGLRNVVRNRVVVLVARRLANVAVADGIVILGRGRIIQESTFVEHTAADGLFRALWLPQNDCGVPGPRTPGKG
ncbi:hypothetical protein ACFYM2_26955 [Streptomyces sp. NPDC006711]|uniref:hypothetical protein n=1 Tax=unclassified Streptomyces TaxID=2593676 RepID=UPI00369E216C